MNSPSNPLIEVKLNTSLIKVVARFKVIGVGYTFVIIEVGDKIYYINGLKTTCVEANHTYQNKMIGIAPFGIIKTDAPIELFHNIDDKEIKQINRSAKRRDRFIKNLKNGKRTY